MKPWMTLVALVLLMVATGIWMVCPQEQVTEGPAEIQEEKEEPAEPKSEALPGNPRPTPVIDPKHETAPTIAEPASAPDRNEMLRAVEEAANNRQALKDWDRKLLLECRKLINEKKFEEAHQCLELRLARNPDEPAIYLERGILHAHMGKLTEAYWDYEKFLELAPDSRDAPRIRAILEKMEADSEQ